MLPRAQLRVRRGRRGARGSGRAGLRQVRVERLQVRPKGAGRRLRLQLGLQLRRGLRLGLGLLELDLLELRLELRLLELGVDLRLLELGLRVVLGVGVHPSAASHGEDRRRGAVLGEELRDELAGPHHAVGRARHDDPGRLPAASLADLEVGAALVLDLGDDLALGADELGDDALVDLHVLDDVPNDGLVAGHYGEDHEAAGLYGGRRACDSHGRRV
mmetsp:Transcript_31887/g.99771  ORF Transcript_31887/g.99771 Transcript_31887/m.99771 type:complete len:217 (-) Transcript_31887:1313-1963(-)